MQRRALIIIKSKEDEMRNKILPTPAMGVALLALVVATGGTAGASGVVGGSNDGPTAKAAKAKSSAKRGPRGKRGPAGPAGPAGSAGPAGPVGPAGAAGAAGARGLTGVAGPAGATGPAGAPGAALAFADVSAAGRIVAGSSKGTVTVTRPSAGTYCITVAGGRNLQATLGTEGGADSVFVSQGTLTGCPASANFGVETTAGTAFTDVDNNVAILVN